MSGYKQSKDTNTDIQRLWTKQQQCLKHNILYVKANEMHKVFHWDLHSQVRFPLWLMKSACWSVYYLGPLLLLTNNKWMDTIIQICIVPQIIYTEDFSFLVPKWNVSTWTSAQTYSTCSIQDQLKQLGSSAWKKWLKKRKYNAKKTGSCWIFCASSIIRLYYTFFPLPHLWDLMLILGQTFDCTVHVAYRFTSFHWCTEQTCTWCKHSHALCLKHFA